MSDDVKNVLKMIEDNDVKFVDFRFTDPKGKWQHTAQTVETIDEELLTDGIMFDGSSIAGWRAINESDMNLKPDLSTAVMDLFPSQPQLILFCDVLEPLTGQPYSRDPRSTAKKADAYLAASGIGDTAYFGAEAEFFVFDSVRFSTAQEHTFYKIDSEEGPWSSSEEFAAGNQGHRPAAKGGYFPVPPVDSMTDLRAEMVTALTKMGLSMEKHHHEVAPSQNELGLKFNSLLGAADDLQIYKYVTHMVAQGLGKTATFMPKPVFNDNGSGMHVHQSIWKGGKNVFAGNGYADLSESALHYIGGIIKHARALNAFTNPTTNSYKRLVMGFEAPVLLAYSSRNRSAACRIPHAVSPAGKRVEVRFPDPACNPYLSYAAMLMAGMDGIENKIDPGDPIDKDLYDLPPEDLVNVPIVSGSLRESLDAMWADKDFLLKGDVFTEEQIKAYCDLRWEEVVAFEQAPHPIEFQMYYSV
ncbi:MAG: type I glutamate--ammonia ligase [Alphaproteobacteria bacterium]|nr:type I glutamate--ammonia ligase [Alphaproteobacteria bacterium]